MSLKIIYRIRGSCKYEKRKNKGRPKLEGYSLQSWTKEKLAMQPTQATDSKSNILGKTNRYCPRYYRAIYKKQLENEISTYYLYGYGF